MEPTPTRLDRRSTKERTRERLLDAAASVFARRGIEAASLDEVADAAGYTNGAIYSNFASKTDLVLALLERRIGQQAEAAEATLAGMTLEQGLQALDDQAARSGPIDRDWIVLVMEFWLQAMRDDRARAAMAQRYEVARTLTASLLERKYQEAGEEPPLPPRELAIVIEALALGVTLQSLLDPETISVGLQAKTLGLLLGGGRASGGASRQGNPGGNQR
ncbi:MAG TPA: TetR/AcrR family transcriptional regulator [Candidatus Limnocylindrales bacterium]